LSRRLITFFAAFLHLRLLLPSFISFHCLVPSLPSSTSFFYFLLHFIPIRFISLLYLRFASIQFSSPLLSLPSSTCFL
jgi:hypothetical protein